MFCAQVVCIEQAACIVREPTGEAEYGIGAERVLTWRWMMRRGVRQKQASDLQLVLDGDAFEKRKKTIEVELQHGMPRPGTGKQTTQTQSTAMST
jgi:hypothetical protein